MGDRRGCGGSRGRDRHGRGGGDDRQDGFLTSATEAGGEHLETQRGQPALTRGRERNLTALATRDDLRDVLAAVLADQLADFDLRISGAVGQLAEQMTSTQTTLNDILDRQA